MQGLKKIIHAFALVMRSRAETLCLTLGRAAVTLRHLGVAAVGN